MPRILVLYHSMHGHVEAMAEAEAEGARSVQGAKVELRRVELATVEELVDYDAIIVGCGTRYGRISAQLANFLDQTGGLWARGALNGKVGAAFTSTATQHGGQETTLFSIITNLMHLGFIVVGLPYSYAGQMALDEVVGGSPYGASTIAGSKGERKPSAKDLDGARFQGKLVAETARKLHGG